MAQKKRSTSNKIILIVLAIAIFACIISLARSCVSDGGNAAGDDRQDANGRPTDSTRAATSGITFADAIGATGQELADLLDDAGYAYSSSDGFWTLSQDNAVYELMLQDSNGDVLSTSKLSAIGARVTDSYMLCLYLSTSRDVAYGLSSQGVSVGKSETIDTFDGEVVIAMVEANGEDGLAICTHYTGSDSYEYELYYASEDMIEEYGVYGLDSRTLSSAYRETISNYS